MAMKAAPTTEHSPSQKLPGLLRRTQPARRGHSGQEDGVPASMREVRVQTAAPGEVRQGGLRI